MTQREKKIILYNGMVQIFLSLFLFFFFVGQTSASVTDPLCYHNLSANSSRDVRAKSEAEGGTTQVCKFCHIPHAPQVDDYVQNSQTYPWYEQIYDPPPTSTWRLPLNSHVLTVSSNAAYCGYREYIAGEWYFTFLVSTWTYNYGDSSVAYWDTSPPGTDPDLREIKWQPSGSSKMCFSCHDGTIKIGALITGTTIEMAASAKLTADGKLRLDEVTPTNTPCVYIPPFISPNPAETNSPWDFSSRHSQGHRVYSSWYTQELYQDVYNTSAENDQVLVPLDTARQTGALDRNDFVQCTSCHDPHISQVGWLAGGTRQFWRKPNQSDGAVCGDCHTTK